MTGVLGGLPGPLRLPRAWKEWMGLVQQGLGVGAEGPSGEDSGERVPQEEASLLEEAFVSLTPSCRSGRGAEVGFLPG